jgi:hypothetical protein
MKKFIFISLTLVVLVLLGVYAGRALSRSKPRIAGSSCEEWAQSYGTQLEKQSLAILDAAEWPADPADRMYAQVAAEVSTGLNQTHERLMQALAAMYERQPAAFANCTPETFYATVEQQLSPRFRRDAPPRFATAGAPLDWNWYTGYLREQINIGMHVYENQNRVGIPNDQ